MKHSFLTPLGRLVVTGLIVAASTLSTKLPALGNPCVTPPSGLAAWWQAEGNTSCDVNGFAPPPIGNLTYSNGEDGLAFAFDGSTSYIQYPALSAFDIGSQGTGVTIEGWVNPNCPETAAMPIIEWDSTNADGLQLWLELNHTLFANLKDTIGNNHGIISSNEAISTNVWQHVALTYDNASGIAELYVNGTLAASNSLGSFTLQTTYPVNLGRRTVLETGYQDTFNGLIDELAIYTRALSQTEIQSIYNAGNAGKCTISPVMPPVITAMAPVVGTNGTTVTLTGTNFSATAGSNIVYFGSVQAAVSSASSNQLTVVVPPGAIFAPVTLTVGGLTAFSPKPFLPTFPGSTNLITSTNFGPAQTFAAGNGPVLVVLADLDGDGKPDLAFVDYYDSTLSVCRNTGNGTNGAATFAPAVIFNLPAASPLGLAAADIDGDGKLDLVVTESGGNEVSIYRNLASPGSFTTNSLATPASFATGNGPQGLAVADFDGDGKPDIAVANQPDGTVSLLRNLSTPGSLTTNSFAAHVDLATAGGCIDVAVGDLDGDGKPDLVTPDYFSNTKISILRNLITAPGAFTTSSFAPHLDLTTLNSPRQINLRDVDGDGKLDIVVAEGSGGNAIAVFRNLASPGTLTNSSFASRVDFAEGSWANCAALGDLNGDGRPDVAATSQQSSHWSVFANTSSPGTVDTNTFAARIDLASGSNPNGIAIGDLDGDGRPDVVFCNDYGNSISIYQNLTPFSSVSKNATTTPLPQVLCPHALANHSICFIARNTQGDSVQLSDLTNYEAQASTDLVNWITLPSALTLTNGSLLLLDCEQTNYFNRFYRIVQH